MGRPLAPPSEPLLNFGCTLLSVTSTSTSLYSFGTYAPAGRALSRDSFGYCAASSGDIGGGGPGLGARPPRAAVCAAMRAVALSPAPAPPPAGGAPAAGAPAGGAAPPAGAAPGAAPAP